MSKRSFNIWVVSDCFLQCCFRILAVLLGWQSLPHEEQDSCLSPYGAVSVSQDVDFFERHGRIDNSLLSDWHALTLWAETVVVFDRAESQHFSACFSMLGVSHETFMLWATRLRRWGSWSWASRETSPQMDQCHATCRTCQVWLRSHSEETVLFEGCCRYIPQALRLSSHVTVTGGYGRLWEVSGG